MTSLTIRSLGFILPLAFTCACCDGTHGDTFGEKRIMVDPEEVHFRTLNREETDVEITTVKNVGTVTLIIDSVSYDGPTEFSIYEWGGKAFSTIEFPVGIPQPYGPVDPFEDLSIIFTPAEEGEYTGEVTIVSNADNSETITIPVYGTCLEQ